MELVDLICNLFSPPQCVFCNKPLDVRVKYLVCDECAESLPYNNGKTCRICATPLDIAYGDLYCGVCKHHKRSFAQNVSRYIYKDGAADALKRLKFTKGQLWIADALGKFLSQTIENEYQDINFDAVLYVPISKKRLRNRGFNQAEIIAEAICNQMGLTLAYNVLVKPMDTPKQSSMKFEERKANVKGAFEVKNSEFVIDKTLLLIDDICTTGSTLDECSKALKKAGAAAVFCATVASTAKL